MSSKLLKKLRGMKSATSLKDQIASANSTNKTDGRFLNYFDMKSGETMKLLLIPFEDGTLFHRFKNHGPNLKHNGKRIQKANNINCAYTSSGQECPACQAGFDLLALERETGDKNYREEAKKWFASERVVAQVLVLESPVTINDSPDNNEVKLFNVPYKVERMIANAISEGLLDEQELWVTPLILKKTGGEKKGEFASYEDSYFARKEVTDEEMKYFDSDDVVVKIHSIDELMGDAFPNPTTTEEVQEWYDAAEAEYLKAMGGAEDEDEEEPQPRRTVQKEKREAPARRKEPEPEQEYDEDVPEECNEYIADEPEDEVVEEETPAASGSVRDRLARLRDRK